LPSSSLVPADDPTLLFTNAGMVQFKRIFQGLEKRKESRAVTVQKCVRAGGKHNDLEQVGHTSRHHTFFEMLGNFSFGNYFKPEAIEFAWEWVTSEQYLGIDPKRLYATVHHTDDEAARLWHQITRIPNERIYRLGDKDNFWQMGDTGPCGPCSEIFVDLRPSEEWSGNRVLSQDGFEALGEAGDLLEIWNLVFMQFDQAKDGSRTPLPAPSVDTGAGLERIAAIMQRVPSNFDTDLFVPLLERAEEVIGKPYDRGPEGAGYRVLADHARAVAFLLADGVYPGNDGRGYVLRRILRRGVRHAYLLGRSEPTLVHLAEVVIDTMGDVYPELRSRSTDIVKATRVEEERFLDTIAGGLRRLDEMMTSAPSTISGADAFKLHDTYGFPVDLTTLIATERGWKVDQHGFESALAAQREASRRAKAVSDSSGWSEDASVGVEGPNVAIKTKPKTGRWTTVTPRKRQRFVGYETTSAETDILKFRQQGDRLDLMLHENPFYTESGGQVSDTGVVEGAGWVLPVGDVIKWDGKQVVTGSFEGPFEATRVTASVDEQRRRDIERNHTATHLVHAALRKALGEHVRQAGSVVDSQRLRFDFSHHGPVSDDDLRSIAGEVNHHVWENIDIETCELPRQEALEKGAMALFGEKYGDTVRVVDIPGVSLELCGGTHVRSTGQIGLFRFTHQSGVAAGVRRIEAVTGPGAYDVMRSVDDQMADAALALRINPKDLAQKIQSLVNQNKKLERQVEDLLKSGDSEDTLERHAIGDVSLFIGESSVSDRNQIGLILDAFREQHENALAVLMATGDRPGIHVAVTDDLVRRGVRAGDVVNRIAEVTGGRGGGRPHFASASAGDLSKMQDAKAKTPEIVRELLPA